MLSSKEFNPKEIAFAVITFYPKWHLGKVRSIADTDKIRGNLGLEFIKRAVKEGYPIVVVDGQSSKNFRRELTQIPNLKLIKRRGYKRSPAKRQAYKAASKIPGVKVIIAAEPEKVSLLESVEKITQPLLSKEAEIVVPKREDGLFKSTYPDYMYQSEIEGNKLYNAQLKLQGILNQNSNELDMFFGPRAFLNNPKTLSLFIKTFPFKVATLEISRNYFDPEELSSALFFSIVLALKKGLRIKSIEIPFSYPQLQKENESRGAREYFEVKRKTQKLGLLLELMHLLNYLK